MEKIVSGNYRNRQSTFPWLVRGADEDPEQAVACKNVTAVGVTFQEPNAYERSFGCTAVARCEDVIVYNDEAQRPEIIGALTEVDVEIFTWPGLRSWGVRKIRQRVGDLESLGFLKSRLRFRCGRFYDEADGRVEACEVLQLTADRAMVAFFAPEVVPVSISGPAEFFFGEGVAAAMHRRDPFGRIMGLFRRA